MSAGVSNSKGRETTDTASRGSSKQKSWQLQDSDTTYDNTSTTQTNVPKWAKQLNRNIATERAEDERGSRDFLSALLTDPYDTSGPQNRYGAAIGRLFDTKLAEARGGTSNTGVARQGFREGAALAGAQDMAIGQGVNAANSLLVNANPLAALEWERLVAPQVKKDSGRTNTNTNTQNVAQTNTMGSERSHTSMTGQNSGYGITLCCFIFMEHFGKQKMPWFVRRCRDEFASGPRVEGYRRMAKYTVPLMQRSRLVRSLVNLLMIAPLCGFGGWLYGAKPKRYRFGWVAFPMVAFWFSLWAAMGQTINFEPNE
jgi:hypothetical protein